VRRLPEVTLSEERVPGIPLRQRRLVGRRHPTPGVCSTPKQAARAAHAKAPRTMWSSSGD